MRFKADVRKRSSRRKQGRALQAGGRKGRGKFEGEEVFTSGWCTWGWASTRHRSGCPSRARSRT